MTIGDAIIIVGGSVALLALFVTARVLYESGTVDVWGLVRRYVAVRVAVPDHIGSSSAPDGSTSGVVLPSHRNQTEADFDLDLEAEREATTLRQLTKNELIVMLAVQRKENGGYLFTSNEIKKFVGGRAEIVGATIATVRGTPKPVQGAPLKRPARGW